MPANVLRQQLEWHQSSCLLATHLRAEHVPATASPLRHIRGGSKPMVQNRTLLYVGSVATIQYSRCYADGNNYR